MRAVAYMIIMGLGLSSIPLEAQSPPQAVVECESPGKATVRITVQRVTYVVRIDCGTQV